METKICTQCLLEKSVSDFSPKGKVYASKCKTCKASNRRNIYNKKRLLIINTGNTQVCKVCNIEKSITDFNKNANGSLRRDCKSCQSLSNQKRKNTITSFINEIKNVPCMDCGISYPPFVMDFDHRPNEIKIFNISFGRFKSIFSIMEEIKKCDIVCSNCHRIRTNVRLKNNAIVDQRQESTV